MKHIQCIATSSPDAKDHSFTTNFNNIIWYSLQIATNGDKTQQCQRDKHYPLRYIP